MTLTAPLHLKPKRQTRPRKDASVMWWVYRVCEVLTSHPEGIKITPICAVINTYYGNVKPILDLMLRRGLLSRTANVYYETDMTQDLLRGYRTIKRLLR